MEFLKVILGLSAGALGLAIAVKGEPLGFIAAILSAVIWFLDFTEGRQKDRKIIELNGSVVHLKTQTNPRTLREFEGGEIVAAVQRFGGQKIDVTYTAFNVEAENFCDLLASCFKTGGLHVHKHAPIVRDMLASAELSFAPKGGGGVLISYAESRKELANELFKVLKGIEVSVGPPRLMDGSDEDDFEYGAESILVQVSQKDA